LPPERYQYPNYCRREKSSAYRGQCQFCQPVDDIFPKWRQSGGFIPNKNAKRKKG
jgi:hypothetical protein